jgi:hypothetical protein
LRISAEDYAPLKAFFAWATEHLLGIPASPSSDQHPVAVLSEFEVRSPARARDGLAMAIGDIIEMSENFSAGQVAAIDAALAAEGIITLSDLRARFWSRVRRLLERGAIRGERDYYALRNVVEALPEEEQSRAWQMLAAFEERMIDKAR